MDWRALARAEFPAAAGVTYFDRPNPLFVCRRAVEEAQRWYAQHAAAPHDGRPWRDEIERVRARFADVLGVPPREIALCDATQVAFQATAAAMVMPVVDLSPDFGMVPIDRRAWEPALRVVSAYGVAAVHRHGDLKREHALALFENESRNVAGILALGGCVDVLAGVGTDAVASRVAALGIRLDAALAQAGLDIEATRGRTTVIRTQRPNDMRGVLEDCGVAVSAEPDGVGASVHLFTREDDIEHFVALFERILRGGRPAAPAPRHPVVCVDLNGVLDAYRGWQGEHHWDPPAPGARDFLATLRARGCRIVLFTTRYYRDAWRWLETYGLADFIDEVTDRKPPGDVFLDDHAVPFGGDYEQALRQVERFTPHWQRSGAT